MAEHPLARNPEAAVAVIGGGPAGLAAAETLARAGVGRVTVIEREREAGGVPRLCLHSPFGMREFRRVLRGPAYAARLVARARAAGAEIHTGVAAVRAGPGGALLLATPEGPVEMRARRVILAVGARESPRAAQLIAGDRVQGVMNTGALQGLIRLGLRPPFSRPVVLGSELVAFSAILSCRHAGVRPAAMIEPGPHVLARWPSALLPALAGIPVLTGTRLLAVLGEGGVVSEVLVAGPDGAERAIPCDGVIVTGRFTPETGLVRGGPLALDAGAGGPVVDQFGRCSDPAWFAAGNVLRPVETAGWCWREGAMTGAWVARDLAGRLPGPEGAAPIEAGDPRLKYVVPQRLAPAAAGDGMAMAQLRVREDVRGELTACSGGRTLWRRRIDARPERRILAPLRAIAGAAAQGRVTFEIREKGGA